MRGARTRAPDAGELIRRLRKRRGLGQAELARRAETTQAQVSRIERGEISPSLGTLERLLGAMGETLSLGALSLDAPPPGGGNTTVRELRADYERLTAEDRLEQVLALSEVLGELAAQRPTP